MEMENQNQNQQILKYLQQGKKITPIEALNLFGCFRLSARIYDLRAKGFPIKMERLTKNNKTFAQYFLAQEV